jgi:heterotetrameric sarcosine oxidase delta subunit
MRITCPLCGARDLREFYYQGAAVALARPEPDAGAEIWDDYVHNRENLAGVVRELWHHQSGCSGWLVVTRNTVTHEVLGVVLASERKGSGA